MAYAIDNPKEGWMTAKNHKAKPYTDLSPEFDLFTKIGSSTCLKQNEKPKNEDELLKEEQERI